MSRRRRERSGDRVREVGGRLSESAERREALATHFSRLLPPEGQVWMERPQPACVGFRVHTLRGEEGEALKALRSAGLTPEPIPARRVAYSVPIEQRTALTHSPLCDAGALYVMNPSSMLAVEALDPQPGEEVLDLASAPGGKSLLIADQMQNEGRLACVEPVKGRFFRLKENLKRGGVSIAQLYQADGIQVGRKVPARFDRVLLDAPCSSEARVRLSDPDSWAHWSPRKVKETSRKQRKLLLSALQSVKVGGRVVYSTCALSPEENEGVISYALRRFEGEVEVRPHGLKALPQLTGRVEWPGLRIDPRCAQALRVSPDGLYDAFFLCVLTRHA